MAYDYEDNDLNNQLKDNFMLLSNVIRQDKTSGLKVDLSRIEKIINDKIPETVKSNSPHNFYELFTDFKSEYEKFKDFILYDSLIGKNIVALGGGFSSGKSSFLNALDDEEALPADIDPSTSVPTYIVNGDDYHVLGINIFDSKVELIPWQIKQIAHGFGELEDNDGNIVVENTTLGHILESIFLSTPQQVYKNIAFLDTPGYSKPDSAKYSAKTDEQIARGQLNSSNFILWFVQADSGTITEEDIKFIKTLREYIPKLIILSKADKKPDRDLAEIKNSIKANLDMKGVRYVDVLAFSDREPDGYDIRKIRTQLEDWNKRVYESNFARNFKVLFVKCRDYYEDKIDEESRELTRLNTSITRLNGEDIPSDILEPLNQLVKIARKNVNELKDILDKVKKLQNEFFTEIKFISDVVGIDMPEPSEIDLIKDKVQNPLEILAEYKKSKGIKTDPSIAEMLKSAFEGIEPVFNKKSGGSEYGTALAEVIKQNCQIKPEEIKINDVYKNTDTYKRLIDSFRVLGKL
ncbi:MAG: dynamin family protein [Clostridiales bacterium]|nr:dynamin family protein [Clostridiales bacterium]